MTPPPLPQLKSRGVMCCGCFRMMAPDGKPLAGMRLKNGVPEPVSGITADDIAWFASNAECDEAAKKHGWTVEDREGPNHRCPDCIRAAELERSPYSGHVERRGAYVNREDLGL